MQYTSKIIKAGSTPAHTTSWKHVNNEEARCCCCPFPPALLLFGDTFVMLAQTQHGEGSLVELLMLLLLLRCCTDASYKEAVEFSRGHC
jgi:hypothetical protein